MSTQNVVGDDVDLLLKLSEGDRYAFEALYKKYWAYVYDSAHKRVKDTALAEDVTHDVFIFTHHMFMHTFFSFFLF